MLALSAPRLPFDASAAEAPEQGKAALFDQLWRAHFDFVWRLLRRLGVPPAALDDALQDVFLVVHRRLATFEGRSSVKTWLAGIAIGTAANARRRQRTSGWEPLDDALTDPRPGPHEHAAQTEQRQLLERLLAQVDDDQREVLVLMEIEQLSAPDVAHALGINVNTVYSRLRLAREKFNRALERYKAGMP